MCKYRIDHWACHCEVTEYIAPCDYPSNTCRISATFAPRTDYPYPCSDCSKRNINNRFGTPRPTTSSSRKRSSSDRDEDFRTFAERVADKRFAWPPGLDLNLSVAPKRSRISRDNYSSDAPQFRDRKANTRGYTNDNGPNFTSRIANPAQDLQYIAMPAEVPQVLPTTSIFEPRPTSHYRRPGSSHPGSSGNGRNVHRIGSVMTRRSARRSPTYPDSPVSPTTPPSGRRISPKQIPFPKVQQQQAAHQAAFVAGSYEPSFNATFSNIPGSPPSNVRPASFSSSTAYAALKDEVERALYTGQYTAAQIKEWVRFQALSLPDQYELLETYAGCLRQEGEPISPAPRIQRRPVAQRGLLERKVGTIERFADWLWGRK